MKSRNLLELLQLREEKVEAASAFPDDNEELAGAAAATRENRFKLLQLSQTSEMESCDAISVQCKKMKDRKLE